MDTRHVKWIIAASVAAGLLAAFLLLGGWHLLDRLLNQVLDLFLGAVTGFVFAVSRFVEFVNWLVQLVF